MIVDGDPLRLEVTQDERGFIRVIMPTKLELLEKLYESHRWSDLIPKVHILYTPKNTRLKPGMQCVMTEAEFDTLDNTSFVLDCPDLAFAKRTTTSKLFKGLSFLGVSSPDDYIRGISERSVRYHYTKGYVLIWSFDDEGYVLTRMPDISSLISPMDLDECVALDEDLAKYLRGRGTYF